MTPYLRTFFGFIGITDLNVVHAGGTAELAKGQVSLADFLAPSIKEIQAAI